MLIWTIALLLFVSLGVVGFYQGAVRVAFSFVGLVAGFLLAMPLGGIFGSLYKLFGVEHPVVLSLLGPFTAYVAILVAFKAGGFAVHKQVDTYYKYKASDTVRLLFERMNSRVGIAVGMLNAFAYVVLLSVVIYTIGYFTIQVSSPDKDPFFSRTFNKLVVDLQKTGMDKAVAKFLPKSQKYYDGADVLGSIFLNPALQARLSTYPVFLLLGERQEFKAIADNNAFQEFWIKGPSMQEFRGHDLIRPLVETRDWYNNFDTMLGGDFKDLRIYLETGKSPKFDDERILGRWEIDAVQSFNLAKRRKPNMNLQEIKRTRLILATVFRNATLTATPDKKLYLKMPGLPNARSSATGNWEPKSSGGYTLSVSEGEKTVEVEALVDGNRLSFTKDGYGLVFEK